MSRHDIEYHSRVHHFAPKVAQHAQLFFRSQVWLSGIAGSGQQQLNEQWDVPPLLASGPLVNVGSDLCLDASRLPRPCAAGQPGAAMPFCNASLPIAERVASLVANLTEEDVVPLFNSGSAGIPRLGIPPWQVRYDLDL